MNKKMFLKTVCMLALILPIIGCNTLFGDKYKFDYPSDIKSVCQQAKDDSKARIESLGDKLNTKSSLKVTEIPSERKISGYWCFWSTEWNMWVCGLCGGDWIKVACNPNNWADINYEVLVHEDGHYWLMTNFNDWSHNNKYRKLFMNWNEVKGSSTGITIKSKEKNGVHADGFTAEDVAEMDNDFKTVK